MYKLRFRKIWKSGISIFSLFFLIWFFTVSGFPDKSLAQGAYSAAEQIYLKNITPILYEFSQTASEVSASVLPLQSAPPEECAAKFADYRGIVDSLAKEIGSLTPPPRLEAVHENSMQALSGYLSGLELYYKACTDKDYGVKESLVSQGGVYLNKSVVSLNKAYDEIENLKSAVAVAARQERAEEITEGDLTEAGVNGESAAEETGAEVTGANAEPPPHKVKTKEQVIKEISKNVKTEKETQVVKKSAVAIPDNKVEKAPENAESKPKAPESPTVKEEVKEETLQPTEPPATESQALKSEPADVKNEEVKAVENPEIAEQKAVAETEEKGIEPTPQPAEEMSDKERVEKLNQKIMEQASANTGAQDSQTAGNEKSETPASEAAAGGQKTDESAEVTPSGDNTAGNAPEPENQEVAVAPPGGVPEELKEEEVHVDDIKSWCQENYQTEPEREKCMKSRAVAKDKTDKLANAYSEGTKEKGVLDKCMSDWKEGNTYNYEMVISCTQFFCTQGGIEKCKDLSK